MAGAQRGAYLGTDDLGRDQLSRVIYAVRTAAISWSWAPRRSLLIGAAIGSISGMRGGMVDNHPDAPGGDL